MPTWEPWWCTKYPNKPLVQGIQENYSPPYVKECPQIINVLPLSKLTVSTFLIFTLAKLNIILLFYSSVIY